MTRAERTIYGREWARRKRDRLTAEANVGATTCQKRMGPAKCGGVLDTFVVSGGMTVTVCPWCERQRAGVCRECPSRVVGKVGHAIRCAVHLCAARTKSATKYRTNHVKEYRASARRVYQRDPQKRQRRIEYNKAWRKANPEKIRGQKRRYALRGHMREKMRELRASGHTTTQTTRIEGLRVCLTVGCEIVLTGRKKKCTRCKEHEAEQARAFIAAQRSRAA